MLVANPGSVYASTFVRGSPRSSMHRTATRSACVESRPPDTPITTFLIPVARRRVARPPRWIAYTSAQRSSRSLVSAGTKGNRATARRKGTGVSAKSKRVVIRRARNGCWSSAQST